MASATLKLFLPFGDPKRLRTVEISNWSGKAIAAPRTELDDFLSREEMSQSGVYILIGTDPESGKPMAYIGEAEVLRDRLRAHRGREFWVTVVALFSKDENLTKSHIRYLEGRLIDDARAAKRFVLDNANPSGARLPESDRHDMEEFLQKVHQLLPVLGIELLTHVVPDTPNVGTPLLTTGIRGLRATGRRTTTGFVVLSGSQAVPQLRNAAPPNLQAFRQSLIDDQAVRHESDRLVFLRDFEFSSPSAAATFIHGGNVNGLVVWKDEQGLSLRELEEK